MTTDDDFDPVEFIRTRRSQDEAWAALQRPLARVLAEPAMIMLAGKDAKHLRGYDLTRKLCLTDYQQWCVETYGSVGV